MYIAYTDGSESAFAVINTADQGYTLHLYPDGERRWLIHDGAGVLEQLRRNERFRKFEDWLRSGGVGGSAYAQGVGVGPVLLEEGIGTAYVFVTALGSSLSTAARQPYLPAVYPPLDQEVATYLLLARVTARQGGLLNLDPESLWLLPRGSLNSQPSGHPVTGALEVLRVGSGAPYAVIAGGTKPENWAGLRNFAWFSPLPDGDNQLMGGGQTGPATAQFGGATPGGWGLTVFAWGLGDYPEANVLLQFKTDAELTLEAYNAGVRHGVPMALAAKASTGPTAYLVGVGQLTAPQVVSLYEQAAKAAAAEYLELPVDAVIYIMEKRMELTLPELVPLLLALARATRKGQFVEAYARLLPQGLINLVRLFAGGFGLVEDAAANPTVQRYIRDLALECQQQLTTGSPLQPQAGGAIEVVLTAYELYKVGRAIYEALISFHRADPRPVFRVVELLTPHAEHPVFRLRPDVGSYRAGWSDIQEWYKEGFKEFGVPFEYRLSWGVTLAAYRGLAIDLHPVGLALIVLGYQFMRLTTTAANIDVQRQLFHSFLKAFAFLNDAKDQEWFPAIASVLAPDVVQLVLYKDRGRPASPVMPNIGVPVKDIAVVEYRDKLPDGELLGRLESLVSTLRKPKWESAKIGSSMTLGVDLATVVFSRKVTPVEVDTIREFIGLLEGRFPFTENPDIPPGMRDKYVDLWGSAIVIVWSAEGSDTVTYHWHDLGPAPASLEHRRRTIASLMGVPESQVRSTDEEPPTSVHPRPASSTGTVVGGGLWGAHEHLHLHPVSVPRR